MDVPVINNRKNFLFQNHPQYHPESIKYIEYWRWAKKCVIEGYWAQDTTDEKEKGMWRFMPPQLFFYVNFCYILHKEEGAAKTAPRKKVHPNLDDIDWSFFYIYLEARGFSGFKNDDKYTCCRDVELFENGKISEIDIPKSAYNLNGKLKKYTPVRTYIMKLHDKQLGLPIYDNDAKNVAMLSPRAIGKSFWLSQGCVLHEIITDGAKEYNEDSIKHPAKIEIFVGAAMASKSSEMLEKTQMALDNLPGIWRPGTEDEVPSPFYKKMSGTLSPNNIKNPWKCEYEKKYAGEWKKVGSGSNVKHGIWTIENPEAAAGGRYNLVIMEEFGLCPNSIAVHMSNIPTMFIEHKFGSALYLGCVCAGTKVWANDGRVLNIEDISIEDGMIGFNGSGIECQNINIINPPNKKSCYRIKFIGGESIECSDDHPFLINNKKTSYGARPIKFEIAENLKPKDSVCIPDEIPIFGDAYFSDSYLLGLLIGDGYYGSNTTPSLSCNEESIYKYLTENYNICIKKQFKQKKSDNIYYELSLSYNDLVPKLREFGILGQKKLDKKLPSNIHEFNKKSLSELIAGYFDADGNITRVTKNSNGRVVLSSISRELLSEVKYQLIKFGIHCTILKENRNSIPDIEYSGQQPHIYRLYIAGFNDIKRFKENIPIKSIHKIKNLDSLLEHTPNRTFNNNVCEKYVPSNVIEDEYFNNKNISGIRFLTIRSVEPIGERDVYNLNCNSTHTYLANNIITHNTGGNIEKIQQSQAIFCDPEGFDCLEFDDIWENTGKIGYFIPATYGNRKFKDENGNTKIEEATRYYESVRDKKRKARTGGALDSEMLNYPLVPSEMFLSKAHNKFPLADLKQTLSELLTNEKLVNAAWKGHFKINEAGKIEWNNEDIRPIREFPVRDANNIEGCWEIYQHPVYVNDTIPYGRYGSSLDPTDDDDNSDKSRSLQSCFIMDLFTDTIVAEYTGRTKFAKDFYEQVRRAMMYYNCKLLYENNKKGLFAYFEQKNSNYLLEDTPEMLKDMDMQKLIAVGNKSKGVYMNEALINYGIDLYAQWLMSQAYGKADGVTNAHCLRSIGLIRESLVWSKDINADRVSSILILMILRETKIKQIETRKKADSKKDLSKDDFWNKHYNQTKRLYNFVNPE